MDVLKLPAVVITKILAELSWIDKLSCVQAIVAWSIYLETRCSWPYLIYHPQHDKVWKSGGVNVRRINFLLYCIEKYGQYMKRLVLNIVQVGDLGFWEFQLFEAIFKKCTCLRSFKVSQTTLASYSFASIHNDFPWSPILTKTYLDILKKKHLIEVQLIHPRIDWSAPESNPFLGIINNNLQHKVTVLKLSSDSLEGQRGVISCIANFINLRNLLINCSCINNEIILTLALNKLRHLSLYQDEDIPFYESNESNKALWKKVAEVCPVFRIDLLLQCVIVLKDHFPPYMPLRKLVLDNLQTSITKGLLDDIISNYHLTLQSFSCGNSSLTENTDSRMEVALVNMVKKCENLQELEYEFSISSSTVLLIAKTSQLKKLKILRVEVSYDFDDDNLQNHPAELFKWLKENSKNEDNLQKAVSKLFGKKWSLKEKSELTCASNIIGEINS